MILKRIIQSFLFASLLISISFFVTNCTKQTKEIEKPNFQHITDIKVRKQSFIDYMLPFIYQVQKTVLNQRKSLEKIQIKLNQNQSLSKPETKFITDLCQQYKVDFNQSNLLQVVNDLLTKVNTIPISMVLAQSALETGWGTSRFSVEGNNYFGQHCFTRGCGIVPKQRATGAINEVQTFDSPLGSVQSYFNLLNTGSKFEEFRKLRAQLTAQGKDLTGKYLVKTLVHYSELKNNEYENRLLATMDCNNLYQYN